MNRSLKLTILLTFIVVGCAKTDIVPTSNHQILNEKFNIKSSSSISQSSCESSGGYSNFVDSVNVTYPWENYADFGYTSFFSGNGCVSDVSDPYYKKTCGSLKFFSEFIGKNVTSYHQVAEELRKKSVPVREYSNCYFPNPASASGGGGGYSNPSSSPSSSSSPPSSNSSGDYEPYGSSGMHTLSVNVYDQNCKN